MEFLIQCVNFECQFSLSFSLSSNAFLFFFLSCYYSIILHVLLLALFRVSKKFSLTFIWILMKHSCGRHAFQCLWPMFWIINSENLVTNKIDDDRYFISVDKSIEIHLQIQSFEEIIIIIAIINEWLQQTKHTNIQIFFFLEH